jgi:formate dehydrogenase major subunit
MMLNGLPVSVPEGATILDAAGSAGVSLPAVCHDPRLRPTGSCRLCLVEIEGESELVPACTTPASEGLSVTTHSEALEHFRRTMLHWYAAHVSASDFAAYPDKQLHRLMHDYGVEPAGGAGAEGRDNSVPHIRFDPDQCIQCMRCVRICDELQGEFVWEILGHDEWVLPKAGLMGTSGCVACGACADSCPTAALIDSRAGAPEQWTRTVCTYCGVGCELEAGSSGNRIVAARPVLDAAVSKGHLCVKGRYAFDFAQAPDRQLQPLMRSGEGWAPLSWSEALERCATGLLDIRERYGPDAIGVLGSSRATNEENYLTQKFARTVIGTNNVDCCARVCHAPSAAALKTMLGAGASTNSFDDIERAGTILVVGANPLECHPIVGARIRQRKLRGEAALIVVDPRRTELAAIADVHLGIRPGTDIALLNALAHVILAEKLADRPFLRRRVEGLEAFESHVAAWPPGRAAAICDVDAADIRAAARLYANGKPSFCAHGLGVTEHVQGTEGVMALIDLALLTGNLGKPGSGINPLRGQNNVQGAALMGCEPGSLTGGASLKASRGLFEEVWGAALPERRGMTVVEMIDAAAAGGLKALWAIGYDILPTLASEAAIADGLSRLDLLIVQDLFLTETAKGFGHIFLPAASAFEKDGTFMNSERRVQRVRQAVAPVGASLPDWLIIRDLAARMGHGEKFDFSSPEEIWEEVRKVWPDSAGISYARLDRQGLQWPCRSKRDPGTSYLHARRFASGGKATLQPIEYRPPPEATDELYPFLMTTGRSLYQFNCGDMTRRTATLLQRPTDMLDMNPKDAGRLGLAEGDAILVESRYGRAELLLHVDANLRRGELFATFHDPARRVNRLTGPHRDKRTGTPEYKVTAVRVSAAAGAGR